MLKLHKIYDNNETIDQYTVILIDPKDKEKYFYAMSYNARAFNQFCGQSSDGYTEHEGLGKEVSFNQLTQSLQNAIETRMKE